MCLIIHKPPGHDVPMASIESALQHNPDGVGIMAEGNAMRWLKIKPKKITKHLARFKDVEAAVHFRWATHGQVTTENCHPFQTADGSYLMHNGVLGSYLPKPAGFMLSGVFIPKAGRLSEKVSDTREFIRQFVDPMIAATGQIDMDAVGKKASGQRLLFMDPTGKFVRVGHGWVEFEGCWYSNTYAWDNNLAPAYTGWEGPENWSDSEWATWLNSRGTRAVGTAISTSGRGYDSLSRWGGKVLPMFGEEPERVRLDKVAAEMAAEAYDQDQAEETDQPNDWPPADAEALLDDALEVYASEIDMSDTCLVASEDWDLYSRLCDGTIDLSDFLLSVSPETKLNCYTQLVRRGHIPYDGDTASTIASNR